MAVLTGRSGQLYVGNTRVARCTGWSLDEQRPMLESTPLDSWDRVVVPGRRSGAGSATLLYDPDDTAAGAFFDSILLDTKNEVPVSLFLDSLTGESRPVTVHVSSASHAVAKGEAQMRDISFKLSDISVELDIIGSAKAAQGATQFYTGAVYGLSGAWTFLWTSSGPTIDDPTSQSTNITFPALGTFTLTLTATLGTTVLTDTLTIDVIALPLMWISRPNYLMASTGASLAGTCFMDTVNQEIYHLTPTWPDASVSPTQTVLSKFSYAGTRLETRKINGLGTSPGTSDYHTPSMMQVINGGDLFLAFNRFNQIQIMRLSANLSTIVWQQRYTGININGATYDPSVNRIIFYQTSGAPNTASLGTIEMSTGALARFTIGSLGATLQPSRMCLLESGRIIHASVTGNSIVLIEFNNDLRVGGVPGPVKAIEHQFASVITFSGTSVFETENYIAVIALAQSAISLFNKSDLSHVKTRHFATSPIVNVFYSGTEFCFVIRGTAKQWISYKINEDLTTVTGMATIATGAGDPDVTVAERITGVGTDLGNNFDADLGLVAIHLRQRNGALTLAEMVIFQRAVYSASGSLNYGPYTMGITPGTPSLGATLLTPTASVNRTYTFTSASSTTAAGSVTISADTNPYLSYVLT